MNDHEQAVAAFVSECEPAALVMEGLGPRLEVPCNGLLLLQGSYSPYPQVAQRVFVIDASMDHPTTAPVEWVSVWMVQSEFELLQRYLQQYAEVRLGSCDAMAATDWTLAWTTDSDAEFQLWTRKECTVHVSSGLIHLAGRSDPIEAASTCAVHASLSADWVTRELRLVMNAGDPVVLAQQKDRRVALDFTYDEFNLICDAYWLVDSAKTLASVLDVHAITEEITHPQESTQMIAQSLGIDLSSKGGSKSSH